MSLIDPEKLQHMDELTKDEFYAVARLLKPDITREEYEVMWLEFCEVKRKRILN